MASSSQAAITATRPQRSANGRRGAGRGQAPTPTVPAADMKAVSKCRVPSPTVPAAEVRVPPVPAAEMKAVSKHRVQSPESHRPGGGDEGCAAESE